MSYVDYSSLNTLSPVSFIAGSTFYIDFSIYNSEGVQIEVTGKTLEWRLSPYGEKNYTSIIKTEAPYISDFETYGGGVTNLDLYTKRITLEPSDTENLSGRFIQQVVVTQTNTDLTTTTFKPSQGEIIILSSIKRP